jgi:hypothetical protein
LLAAIVESELAATLLSWVLEQQVACDSVVGKLSNCKRVIGCNLVVVCAIVLTVAVFVSAVDRVIEVLEKCGQLFEVTIHNTEESSA